jgi:hypothetical protein
MVTRRKLLSLLGSSPALGLLNPFRFSEKVFQDNFRLPHPVRSGQRHIDLAIGGFYPGQLIVVGVAWPEAPDNMASYQPLRDVEEHLDRQSLGKAFAKNLLRHIALDVAFDKKRVLFATTVISQDRSMEEFAHFMVERMERTNGLMSEQEKAEERRSCLERLCESDLALHKMPASSDPAVHQRFWRAFLSEIQTGKYSLIVLDDAVTDVEGWLTRKEMLKEIKKVALRSKVPVLLPGPMVQSGPRETYDHLQEYKTYGDVFINCLFQPESKLFRYDNPSRSERYFEWTGKLVSERCPCENCHGHDIDFRIIWLYALDMIHLSYLLPKTKQ